ncbi:hypothetical protein D1155_09105 [Anaerotruncus sp. 80]|uniref:SH3 domain-containing protein n=1 Tax=Anaerotruncus colihominis TaxID=169435 RepID=A0A845QM88_9FIRM|nr:MULTISPECIES: hypothetical protein [Anaerotruncus]NBH61807.1 hypothetical protein [Anaerotruncus colihominis]NCF02462.1 hypothetical protein [Anaerotruncus sp. 80]
MKKKIILLLCFLLALNLCCTSITFAGTASSKKTMYAKQQTWIYSSGHQEAKYAVCPIGKGQQVKVGKKVYAVTNGKKHYYYQTSYFNKTFYIPAAKLTTKKPKEAYSMTYSFRELLVTPKLYLYASPSLSSAKRRTSETSIYTIGETKNWYVVFVSGKLGYISKKSSAIKQMSKPTYVPLHIDSKAYSAAEQKQIMNRFYVQYALLPSYMRDGLLKRDTEIYIQKKLKEPFESNGNAGYTTSSPTKATIFIKEFENYNLEFSLHHEVGHALSRHLWPGQSINELEYLIQENKTLQLGSYYASNAAEWLAECIDILIKDPNQLQDKAPMTYQLLMNEVFSNNDEESPLRAA